jgi:hypothetical protein
MRKKEEEELARHKHCTVESIALYYQLRRDRQTRILLIKCLLKQSTFLFHVIIGFPSPPILCT